MSKAILLIDKDYSVVKPYRPLKAEKLGNGNWQFNDPLTNQALFLRPYEAVEQGEWDNESLFSLGGEPVTWSQYAKHQLGQVLRQNELAARLRALGIHRDNEPYFQMVQTSDLNYRFQFTFDELEILLNAADQA